MSVCVCVCVCVFVETRTNQTTHLYLVSSPLPQRREEPEIRSQQKEAGATSIPASAVRDREGARAVGVVAYKESV